MLRERGNKKMGKKELNSGIKIVAVRVSSPEIGLQQSKQNSGL